MMMNFSSVQRARGRALLVLGAMIGGIVLAGHRPEIDALVWFAIACGLIAISLPIRGRFKSALLVLSVVGVGAGVVRVRTIETPMDRLDRIAGMYEHGRVPIEITGMVLDPVRIEHTPAVPGEPPMWKTVRISTRVRVGQVYQYDPDGRGTWTNASGVVVVHLPESVSLSNGVQAGDRVGILGMYAPSKGARNLGDLDWRALSAQSGRVGSMVVGDASMITTIEPRGIGNRVGSRLRRWRARMRSRALGAIRLDDSLHDQSKDQVNNRSMLGALLLGQREPSFDSVYRTFQRVGVAHVLAISGFHLALVILLGVLILRIIGEHPRIESAIIITILVLGALIIPMRPPIMRAGVIVGVILIAGRLGRRYDRMSVLAWVGVGLLIWRPMDVFSLGYQLSMGITGLLVMLSQRENRAVLNRSTFTTAKQKHGRGLVGRARLIAFESIKVNLACWAVAIPAIAYHAGIVSLLSPAVSLVLIPMVVIVMVLGYLQIGLGVIAPELASHTIGILDWSGSQIAGFVGWVDSIPGAWLRIGPIGVLWTVVMTGFIGAMVTRRIPVRSRLAVLIGAGMLFWGIAGSVLAQERAIVRIDMLDVGDGSCVLIQSDGQGLIWDCGSLDRRVGRGAAKAARVIGLSSIGDAIITHDNLDHFNGLLDLGEMVGLERVWVSGRMLNDPSYAFSHFERRLLAMGVTIHELQANDEIVIGKVKLVCFWPEPAQIGSMSENNSSIVVRIEMMSNPGAQPSERFPTVLLVGDIEQQAMEAIMDAHPDLRADVLELPHHGSAKPGAMAFVEQLDPLLVLQSTGPTRLNDPRWATVRQGRDWYATAEHGGIWVRIMRDGRIEHGWAIGE